MTQPSAKDLYTVRFDMLHAGALQSFSIFGNVQGLLRSFAVQLAVNTCVGWWINGVSPGLSYRVFADVECQLVKVSARMLSGLPAETYVLDNLGPFSFGLDPGTPPPANALCVLGTWLTKPGSVRAAGRSYFPGMGASVLQPGSGQILSGAFPAAFGACMTGLPTLLKRATIPMMLVTYQEGGVPLIPSPQSEVVSGRVASRLLAVQRRRFDRDAPQVIQLDGSVGLLPVP